MGQPRVDGPPAGWPAGAVAFLCELPAPAGFCQSVDQDLGLLGIARPAKGVAADILPRELTATLGSQPAQYAAGVYVSFRKPDLPQ